MNKSKIIILFLLLIFLYCFLFFSIKEPNAFHLRVFGGLGLIQLLLSVSFRPSKTDIISPYVFFLLALYLFSFGQSLLYTFNIITENDLIGYKGITIRDILFSQFFTLVLLASFQIGATLQRKQIYNYDSANTSSSFMLQRLKVIGFLLLLISIYPYYQKLIFNFTLSMSSGYGAIFDQDERFGFDNFQTILSDFFIPSLICLYIYYRKSKYRLLFELIFIFNSIILLYTGGRTKAIILLALFLILRNYTYKTFSKKGIIIIAVAGYFILSLMTYISSSRSNRNRSLSVEEVEVSSNAAFNAIGEMGSTMFCLIKAHDLVPEREDFRYGQSYIYSFTTAIPNLGFWKVHPAKLNANLSDWLTDTLGLSYGTGFSMCAEAYVNFGYFAFVVFLFWGWIFSSFFCHLGKIIKKENYALCAFIFIVFWFSLLLPRNSFISFIRPFFFYSLPIYWICRGYIYRQPKKKQII